jgi:hypothetical protein
MSRRALYVRDELGQFVPAGAEEILAGAKAYLRSRVRRGIPLTSPQVVRDFLMVNLAERDCEYFCLLLLDTRHRLLKFVELFRGTIDRASVHVREVVKAVIEAQAAAVVLVHNHPLCFVRGVNLELGGEFGLALNRPRLPRRRGRQGAARLTTGSLRCSPEVASQACDGARCGVGRVLVGNPAHSRE